MRNSGSLKKNDGSVKGFGFLLASIFVITIYFDTNSIDPFNTPKSIVLYISAGWLLGHLINFTRNEKILRNASDFAVHIVSILFLVALTISFLFTDVKITGFIGDTQRRNGLLTYIALIIFFLFSVRCINVLTAENLIKFCITTGIVVSFYGFLQVTGNDFIKWDNPYNAMIGTTGNPNFASALLAVLGTISILSITFKKISIYFRIIALVMFICSLILIVRSDSRQGLLVVFFSLLAYYFFKILNTKRKNLKFTALFPVVLGVIAIVGMLQKGPLSSLLYKESVSTRGFYWRAAFEMFSNNFLFGVGLDRYGYYFKEFREPDYVLRYGTDIGSSNAHNVILQLFATGGFFVGLTYLMLLGLIFFAGIKLIFKSTGDTQRLSLILFSAWLGFQAQSFISIDNLAISVWGWLLGGAIIGLLRNNRENSSILEKRNKQKIDTLSLLQPMISALILIPTSMISYSLYRAETDTQLARTYASQAGNADKQQVLRFANNVINNPFSDPNYKLQVSLYLVDVGLIPESLTFVKSISDNDPRNLESLRWLALYETQNNKVENAIKYRIQISKLDPWNLRNYLELGNLYKTLGDFSNMNQVKEKILSISSNSEFAIKAKQELILN